MWFTRKFIEFLGGIIDITEFIREAEKKMQKHEITFLGRDSIHSKLNQFLKNPVGVGPTYQGMRGRFKKTDQGTKFDDVRVAENGSAAELLCEVRHAILSQLEDRLANRGILKHLKCLDVQNWPQGTHYGDQVGVEDFTALFNFYKRRLEPHGISLDSLLAEFDKVKVVWCTAVKPILDNHLFWKQIVSNPTTFPCMHVMI